MNDATPCCVVVGSYNHDLVFRTPVLPTSGETVLGEAMTAHGGKGFNQAIAAGRLGAPTRFLGALGEDLFAAEARAFAEAEGIDARWQAQADAATGLASVVVDDEGANQIVVAAGANRSLGVDFVAANLDGIEHAVVLTQLETSPEATSAALAIAAQRGWISVLDPAPVVPELTWAMLKLARVITPNEHEFVLLAQRFLKLNVADDLAHVDDEVLHKWCRRLEVDTVVLTLGKSGCFVSHDEASALRPDSVFYRVPGVPVAPVDTTGAGDCFAGALAAALLRDPADFPRGCRFANQAASVAVTRPGAAAGMPRLEEL